MHSTDCLTLGSKNWWASVLLLSLGLYQMGWGQESGSKTAVVFTTQQDHQHMLQQLGITKLRPGRSSDEKSPNVANYDESLANPWPILPEVLRAASGELVSSP
jgi:hypothetical protein